jgi:hypothetical protein
MRRLLVRTLLLSCASVLLGAPGCSTRTVSFEIDEPTAGRLADGKKRAGETAETGGAFRLPSDAAGVLLSKELAPRGHPRPLPAPARRTRPDVPAPRFAELRLPLPTAPASLVRLPDTSRKQPVRPEFVQEEGLEESFDEPAVPHKPRFLTSRPAHVPSEDAALPPPLHVMAQPLPDRVPLEDATMEASTAAVLKAPLTPRTTPAPYQRLSVPEPYENRRPLTLLVPAERATPQTP